MKNHNPTAITFTCNSTANPHTVKIHNSAPRSTKGRRNAGFSLVEVMITVLVIAVLGGVALTSFGTTRESTGQITMQGDASMMNKAIQAYIAGGGSLDGVTNPNDVLAKLKTKPLATQAATIAGASGPFVDLRLELHPATSVNAVSLLYVPERTAFVMVNGSSGMVTGVNEELARQTIATEERHVSLALATEDKWVWDYADAATPDRPAAYRPLDKRSSPLGTSTPSAYSIVPLSPPQFSIPGSQLGPLDFPKTLTITHSNPASAGELFVRVNGGEWSRYANAITLPIGEAARIESYTDTLCPDDFSASNMASVAFTFKPGQLTAPTIAPASGQFKWGEFPTTLTLNNTNTAGVSTMQYKIGTSDWIAYTNPVPISMDLSVPVEARSIPVDSRLWLNSSSASALYEFVPQKLKTPVIAKASGSYLFDDFPTTLSLADANLPGTSRLEYKIGNGAWTPYTAALPLTMDLSLMVSARAVPVDPKFWLSSDTVSALYQMVPAKLQTPAIANASGTYTYTAFPSTLSASNPNRDGISKIEYKIGTGNWTAYTAAVPLTLDLSVGVSARAVPLDSRFWLTSDTASATYQFNPQKLQTPVITKDSGKYIFGLFPTPLPIQDPNIAGTSKLEYKIGTGAWTTYTSPVVLTPDTSVAVSSRAVPVDSRLWFTSDTASATYELQSENLQAPLYSKAAGSYPALQYPLTVALTNPNPTGSSTLEYRQLNGTWQAYISPITLAATQVDVTLEARAVTTDAKRWVTSPTAASRYVLTRSTLYAPVITPAGGYYPFSGFPTAATLTNPNPAGSSDIYYRFGTSGTFIKYNPLTPPALSNLNYTTTLQAYAKSLRTVQYDDSPQAQAIYDSIYFTASTDGLFHDPSSATPTKMVTNMAPPKTGSLFKWGGTSGSGQTQSWLQFDGSPSGIVAPGDWFQIGKLTYYNGTITTGTGADKVKLKFALNITLPTATTTNADFTLNLVNTPNTSDANASADYVYIPALSVPFTTTVGGKNFKLDVRFGETTANGFGSLTEFHVLEEKTATGTMYGRMTEIVP